MPGVPSRILEPHERAGIAMKLFRLIDAADCASCRTSRLFDGHAAAAELVLEEREVRRKLSGKLVLCMP
jgi:hypothetical protein